MRRFGVKKILLIAWACALAFGFTFQASEASARHASCGSQCGAACKKSGGCTGYATNGCSCGWVCGDGSKGSSICVL